MTGSEAKKPASLRKILVFVLAIPAACFLGSVLIAAIGIAVIPSLDQSKIDRARVDLKAFNDVLTRHVENTGVYPPGLKELLGFNPPADPWGRDYRLLSDGGSAVVATYGRDGVPGGTDADADLFSSNEASR
jgi:general secretion pathway protein G